MKLIIGNKNYSSWSLRPWLLLKHFNIEFEEIRIPLFTDDFETTLAQYTDANKVPVLHDGKINVWDSLAICEYISEHYLDGNGLPKDKVSQAQARSASAEMHSSFSAIRENMPMNCRIQRRIDFSPQMKSEIERIDTLWLGLRMQYFEQGEWLFGEFSIADCMYAPIVSRFHSYLPELSEMSQKYVDHLLQHPAMQTWYQQARDESEVIQQYEIGVPFD